MQMYVYLLFKIDNKNKTVQNDQCQILFQVPGVSGSSSRLCRILLPVRDAQTSVYVPTQSCTILHFLSIP